MAKKRKKRQAEDEEITLDLQSVKKFFSNKKVFNEKTITASLLIIALLVTLFVRVQPLDAPITEQWAKDTVYNFYRSQIAAQKNAEYPNIPQANKETIINKEFAEFLEANQGQLDAQIASTAASFKTQMQYGYEGEQYTYLGDLDSYYYLRFARNIEENGHICDAVSPEGKCLDTYSMAPLSIAAGSSLHTSTIYGVYKTANALGFNIPLMQASWITPVLVGLLTTLFAFFLGRKIGGNMVGFFGAFIIAMNPVFLSRSMGSDTDGWNVLFPVLIMLLFLMTFESRQLKAKLVYAGLTGLSVFLFSKVWGGWWFMYDLIIATLGIQIVYTIVSKWYTKSKKDKWSNIVKNPEIKHSFFALIIIIALHFILETINTASIVAAATNIWNAVTGPIFFSTFKGATEIGGSLWPNVLTTVAEFNAASIGAVVGNIGGRAFFLAAMMGTVFLLVKPKELNKKEILFLIASFIIYYVLTTGAALTMNRFVWLTMLALPVIGGIIYSFIYKRDVDIKLAIMLTIWFAGTIYASTTGLRFALLLVPAFGIAFAYAIYFIYQVLSKLVKQISIPHWVGKTIIIILLLLILYNPITARGVIATGYGTARGYTPTMNDGWYDTLIEIKEKSEPDAIINSWWDFGHWFKYVADRRVTLDGGTQGFPPLHWLGKTLVTPSQDTAVGVLRMLDCGSNTAFDTLNEVIEEDTLSIDILNEIIVEQDKEDAKDILTDEYGLTSQEAEDVLRYTHCEAPENYFITSEDMVGKAGVWAHFGLWDFKRAEIVREAKRLTEPEAVDYITDKEHFGIDEDQAKDLYREVQSLRTDDQENAWISPWPNYLTARPIGCANTTEEDLVCTTNLNIGSNGAQTIVLENVHINLSDPESTYFDLGAYDPSTGTRVGGNTGIPNSLIRLGKDDFVTTELEDTTFGYDVMLIDNGDAYGILLIHPLLSKSTFTKLFYLDGLYMEDHYEKFSERSTISGQKIIVWKINWEGTADEE